MAVRKRLLILYDHNWLHIQTTVHHLESFHRHSEYAVSYVSSHTACEFDLDYFDAVLIHYSVRICFPGFLSPSFAKALRSYRGVKALMLQDEYDATDAACNAIEDLGIGVVFTCVPEPYIHAVYPRERFSHVEFMNVQTDAGSFHRHRLSGPHQPLLVRRSRPGKGGDRPPHEGNLR